MIKTFRLPIKKDYNEFIFQNIFIKNKKCVYKLIFEDEKFYVGQTHNLASRIYNHLSLDDMTVKTKKHDRMIKAIRNKELIQFELLSENPLDERSIINSLWNDSLILNIRKY